MNTYLTASRYTKDRPEIFRLSDGSQSPIPMLSAHVAIYSIASRKCSHTNPADVGLTPDASDVVAALCTLYGYLAAWAILHIMTVGPFLEQSVTAIAIRARESLVVLDMAIWTNA